MEATAILNLLPVSIFILLSCVDVPVKFHMCTSVPDNILSFVKKIQNGGCRYHELLSWFGNPGPPTKSPSWPEVGVKISFQSHYYDDVAIWRFWKFGLKRLFLPPKFAFLEGFAPISDGGILKYMYLK